MKTDYKKFAENLARQSGKIIRKNFSLGMEKKWKKDITPVTVTDLAVNKLVLDAVVKNFPDHSVIAEEGSYLVPGSNYAWVCDPVDGTIPFSHGVPTGIFLLALVKSGEPILGIAYDPFLDRVFLAEKGRGATLNGQPIRVNKEKQLQGQSVVGLVHWGLKNDPMEKAFIEMNDRWGFIQMCLCSIGYMTVLVAGGEFTAAIFQGRHPWDAAAMKLLVEEAGGKVTNIFGEEQRYDRDTLGFIASNGLVHGELVRLIKKYVKPADLPK